MYYENKAWVGMTEDGERLGVNPKMANRHGLIAGATGTGKTVTLKVMAESFSAMGVPVFLSDVKGDLAGMAEPGADSEEMQKRISYFKLNEAGFNYHGFPSGYWDIYGNKGIQLRTTISEMGPLLLSRLMDLNDLQSDILTIVFKIADDMRVLLIDTKDLKAMLNHVSEHHKEYEADYGKMSPTSIAAIVRALVALETAGGDIFFGEPALNVTDWFALGEGGKGMITILDSSTLINSPMLYSTFLLWLLSELFEILPEVGDMEKPKMVFFFDEAHLLFNDAPKPLLAKIEQVVKLIRSKGVGIYFITQNPRDIPDGILSQLGNKVEHALRAYTPADQKAVKAAAESFPVNPEFDTFEAIMNLGVAEAIVSFLDENGIPTPAKKVKILPPMSKMGGIDDARRDQLMKASLFYSKYANSYDPDSAYEFFLRMGEEEAQAKADAEAAAQAEKERAEAEKEAEKQRLAEEKEAEKQRLAEEKAAEKERIAAEKEAEREKEKAEKEAEKAKEKAEKEAEKQRLAEEKAKEKAEKERMKVIKNVSTTAAGTIGREVGKNAGKSFGSFGKLLGGNVGASLGRGILSTLFK